MCNKRTNDGERARQAENVDFLLIYDFFLYTKDQLLGQCR